MRLKELTLELQEIQQKKTRLKEEIGKNTTAPALAIRKVVTILNIASRVNCPCLFSILQFIKG